MKRVENGSRRLVDRRRRAFEPSEPSTSAPTTTNALSRAPTPRAQVRATWTAGEPGMLTIAEVEHYKRSANCARYLRCLTLARDNEWIQFHCLDCGAYEERPDDRERGLLTRIGAALFE